MDNSETPAGSERRAQRRLKTAIPIRVRGVDAQGTEFEVSTETVEVSRRGLSFLTELELKTPGTVTVEIPGRGPRHAGEGPTDFFSTAAVLSVLKEADSYRVILRFIGATLTTYSAETPSQDAEERY
jgi:hypothetical protein